MTCRSMPPTDDVHQLLPVDLSFGRPATADDVLARVMGAMHGRG